MSGLWIYPDGDSSKGYEVRERLPDGTAHPMSKGDWESFHWIPDSAPEDEPDVRVFKRGIRLR